MKSSKNGILPEQFAIALSPRSKSKTNNLIIWIKLEQSVFKKNGRTATVLGKTR